MFSPLRRRSDFLAVFRNCILSRKKSVMVQFCLADLGFCESSRDNAFMPIFVGITASKKVGNSVRRNLAKRRLRAVLREKLRGELEFTQKALSRSCLPHVSLSKATLNSFFSQFKHRISPSSSQKQLGLVMVFIATRYTPSVEWESLVLDVKNAVSGCLKKNITQEDESPLNLNDDVTKIQESKGVVRVPLAHFIRGTQSQSFLHGNSIFQIKFQKFLKKIEKIGIFQKMRQG